MAEGSRMKKILCGAIIAASVSLIVGCQRTRTAQRRAAISSPILRLIVDDALEQTTYTRTYDPSYVKLNYPNGDVASDRGVCSDVIVRAFRKGGLDLQKAVHEDMARNFAAYPHVWNLTKPDPNIDHRRVQNLATYFTRQGKAREITMNPKDYQPGDVVVWDTGGGSPHIGIVSNVLSDTAERFYIVHNIGAGAKLEDALFSWSIIGHYRYEIIP